MTVGAKEIQPPRRGAHPLAVGSIDSKCCHAFVGHQILPKFAVGDSDIAALHRRGFAVAAVFEGIVAVVDHLDPLVGTHPKISRTVLDKGIDGIGSQLAAIVGTYTGHPAIAIVDIDYIVAPAKPEVARHTVAHQFVDLRGGMESRSIEWSPRAICRTAHQSASALGNQNPEIALPIELEGTCAQSGEIAYRIRLQSATGIVRIEELLYNTVIDRSHSVAPQGHHCLIGIVRVYGSIDQVVDPVEQASAVVERTPCPAKGGGQVGIEVGVGISGGMSSRTYHSASFEGYNTVYVILGIGA